MRNYFNYFTEIEEYFIRKRGKNLLISPLDWCLIELWKQTGIPLHVVLRGIDRSFESKQSRGSKKSSPRTLFYCHPAVQEAYAEYQEAMLGAEEEEVSAEEEGSAEIRKESVLGILDRLLDAVRSAPLTQPERPLKRLEALRSEVARQPVQNPARLDSELNEIGSLVVADLVETLDPSERKQLKAQSRQDLKVYKKRLASETFERLKQNYFEKLVRDHFGLPSFDLLESEPSKRMTDDG